MSFEGWIETTWGELATLEYGKSLRDYVNHNGEIPVFGTNGQIGFTDKPLCPFPSVIVGRKGAYRGIHYSDKPFFVIDTAFYLNPKFDELNIKFAYYQLLTYDINGMDSGSAIPSTSREDFYNLPITLPDLPTQTRIAAILSALDDKIELNRQTNTTLEAIAQAIFKEWFVDFRFPGASGEMQDSELGPIPKGWRIGTLGEILAFKNGKSSPERDDNYDYPVYGANGIIGFATIYNSTEKNIVIGRVGSFCGSVYLPLTKIWVTDNSIMAEPITEKTTIFCFILLKKIQLNTYKTGSGQPLLNQNILSNIEIIIPPIDVIGAYEKAALSLFEQIVLNNQQTATLSATRDTLLPKLMSGEIDI